MILERKRDGLFEGVGVGGVVEFDAMSQENEEDRKIQIGRAHV